MGIDVFSCQEIMSLIVQKKKKGGCLQRKLK